MSTSTDIERSWARDERWAGITRPYQGDDVGRLRGTLPIEYTLAKHGAARLWKLLREEPYVAVLSAVTGNQAVQEVRAGLRAIYISGWQVAADANCALTMYPDQSLYPSDSVPNLICRIQNALRRADEIHHMNGDDSIDWYVPLVADAEAGFGGVLNAYELMKLMIGAGAAGVHFEDQLSSVKKCGHLGGKVLVPTSEFISKLIAARLAADVCGFETAKPDLAEAKQFAEAIHKQYPGKLLAYNCSPSFNWKRHLNEAQLASFQQELGAMGYKFQFVTLSGFHALNHAMFSLARDYKERGMAAYADL